MCGGGRTWQTLGINQCTSKWLGEPDGAEISVKSRALSLHVSEYDRSAYEEAAHLRILSQAMLRLARIQGKSAT